MRNSIFRFIAFSLLVIFTSGFQPVTVEDPNDPTLSQYFISPSSDEVMQQVASKFEVVHREADGFEIIVPARRADELFALVPDAELMIADISAEIRNLDESWAAGYNDLDSTYAYLQAVVAKYPEIAAIKTYGKSKEGRPLLVLKISDNVHLNEAEPEIMITSATHGNELITVEVVLGLIDNLTKYYGHNRRVNSAVDDHELFFIPVVNPDGYVRKSRYANGVDPNREYPWPEKPIRDSNECIASLIKFFGSRDIKGSLDFHSYGKMFMYPWAYSSDDSADKAVYQRVAGKMAEAIGYRHGQISQILYPAPGSSADYYYWKNRTIALGIEIGERHVPNPSLIEKHVSEHLLTTLLFIEAFK